jgi:hypothetical protein
MQKLKLETDTRSLLHQKHKTTTTTPQTPTATASDSYFTMPFKQKKLKQNLKHTLISTETLLQQ